MATVESEPPVVSMAYRQRIEEVIAALGTHGLHGLTDLEARTRLLRDGHNELAAEKPIPAWRRFLAQFQNVLVLLLLVATAISVALWAVERDAALPYEAIAIFAVVLLNATMGYVQESRAESAVAALRAMSAADATVIRDGEHRRIPAADIVAGDVILIEEGDTIPADGRLIESTGLQTAEAALTGESLPVTKDTAAIPEEVPLGDRDSMVFSGTAATYGHGKAIVIATGMRTEMGRIAGLLKETPDESTPLQRELDRTAKVLGSVVIAIAIVMIATIVLVEDVRGAALFDVLILGVALAVAAVPEGLPAVVRGEAVPGDRDLRYAQTMAFTTLMLFQIFNVVNARSDERSAFVHLFTNRWLWAAIGGSIALQVFVVYLPFLQRAFGTSRLSAGDWVFCVAVASSVLWLREATTLVARRTR